jgi:agmatinase
LDGIEMTRPQWVNFGGEDVPNASFEAARCVVLPLCYEISPSYGEGSRYGPLHILEASAQLERLDEETLWDWGTLPIHTLQPLFPPNEPQQAVSEMKTAAARVFADKKFLLGFGGDHAVSIGTISAAAKAYPGLGVLQIDAHLDLRNEWNGSRFNHGCVMRRVADDLGLFILPVGIRAVCPEELEVLSRKKISPVYAHRIDSADDSWMAGVFAALPHDVYLTVDLDGLDPSQVPGTGTPEPGGLSYRQVVSLIRGLCREKNVVAADIVELAKIEGSQVSEYAAARIAQKIITHRFRF